MANFGPLLAAAVVLVGKTHAKQTQEELKSLADMAGSLEPREAKESARQALQSLQALENDLQATREGRARTKGSGKTGSLTFLVI